MGLFCANLHFRTTDDHALSAALKERGVSRCRVFPAKRGWTSLYEERASHQDDARIRDLAGGLSQDLHVAAIAFMVHDSDIACYWLFDDGRLLDEYNSCPDYFDSDATGDGPTSPSGGHPDVLLRYCRKGVRQDQLEAILGEETVFAESVIERLAEALGIETERALADYRDVAGGGGPGGADDDDDEDGGDNDGGPNLLPLPTDLASRMVKMLGADPSSAPADPQVAALVEAAARDDMDEIDRLLTAGVAIEAEAPAPLSGAQPGAGLGKLFPGGAPKIPMTPLLAAVANKRLRSAKRLLDAGADPNRVHPLFGTPVHAATGAGEVELLKLLIDRGGEVNSRNVQGQTPLEVVAASRATLDRLAQAQAMMESMGVKLPGLVEQLSNIKLPTEGWDECERLLKTHGAR
ncbi:MAG: ankyrin repeat domain-containing protein [Planctomycetes bacterium]|nr:ankyrin repeat domain-containing protein [Planctomycetota bacterium]